MKIKILIIFLIIISCGKDSIPDPSPAILISPDNGNNCKTAASINIEESRVDFNWSKATNTDYYQLIAIDKLTNIKFKDTTNGMKSNGEIPEIISMRLTLNKGKAYSWSITSISNSTIVRTESEIWEFYLEGNVSGDYLPQPASLEFPINESLISLTDSNLVEFIWVSSDTDNNILGYDFYLGTSSDNLEKLGDKITQTNFEIQLEVNKSYFWQVVTFDQQGNNSTSGINQFQTQP
tara:strand:+ start:1433 stop:2140 length:708 start_codon:yes stop_codon:yes gene_type:complete